MTRAEIEEEIRAILREVQVGTVQNPWTFTSDDFTPQIRSALRQLAVKYATVLISAKPEGVMDTTGAFTTEPGDAEGILIAQFVAMRLIKGDLIQKLMDGELGVIFKTGSDYIDTTQASRAFKDAADDLQMEFNAGLTIQLTNLDQGTNNIFGLNRAPTDAGA